jgi:lipopolysaccharide transport system ATP-binding protein
LSVGDWAFQNKSMEKMQSILKGGATVVFVSHNLKAVSTLCNRVLLLEKGQVVESGVPSDVVDAYIKRVTTSTQPALTTEKDAVITDVALQRDGRELALFKPGEVIRVAVTVTNHRSALPLAVALGFRDESYNLFFYTDSARLQPTPMRLAAGESKTLEFELDLHLAPGSYFLNVALTQPDLDHVVDHRAPAKTFVVHSDQDVRGVANLYPRLTRA